MTMVPRQICGKATAASAGALMLIAVFMLVAVTCGNLTVDGGFGSETTNGRITGRVVFPDGSPAEGVFFTVRRNDYLAALPGFGGIPAGSGSTDSAGRFVIDSLDTGDYFIEINDLGTRALLKQGLITPAQQSLDLGTDTLRVYAAVEGEINIDIAPDAAWYVQVVGLERCAPVDSAGSFSINDLPSGIFRIRIVCADSLVQPIIFEAVTTSSGDVTILPCAGWRSSRHLVLNTSASGADISGAVYLFPLLVKLRAGVNFLFNGARGKGEDIRFLSADNRTLPYEIERWDSAAGQADIWVLVDTVYGNNSTQYIVMQWGSPNARDCSNSAAVFDTANGFSAVWHLGGDCKDATAHKLDGTESSARDTAGIAGLSKKFSGSDSIKIPGLLGSPASITLSAWAQLDTVPVSGGDVVSLGDAALIRMDYTLDSVGTMGSMHQSGGNIFYNISTGQFLKKTGWHLLTFTVDRKKHTQAFYSDGMNVSSGASANAVINYSGVGQNTFIGKHGNGKTGFNFSGRIDEVRVHRAPVSTDYIRLCYMNQKAQDALVVFK